MSNKTILICKLDKSCDEGFKATSYLLEASKSPLDGAAKFPAVNLAFGFDSTVFEWMADQPWREHRMGRAMQQLHRMANGNVITGPFQSCIVSRGVG